MASAVRRVFPRSLYTRRVFGQRQRLVSPLASQRPWGHDRIPTAGTFQSRSYHGGSGGSSSQNWDGLVYAIMSNIRGEYNFGPECFLSAASADTEEDAKKPRRDMRELVPMRLNRPWLLATAQDIQLRLDILCKQQAHTFDYRAVETMIKTLERLGRMDEDDPKLELAEYRSIFIALRNGLNAESEMPMRIISVRERPAIQIVQFAAECVWGVAVLNAALRNLEGEKIKGGVDADGTAEVDSNEEPFVGDMLTLSWKINGLLLDGKDNFPEGEKWFEREQEQRILESALRVAKEAGKRRAM